MRYLRDAVVSVKLMALVLVAVLASLGIGYASWTNTLTINSSVQTASISARWLTNADTAPLILLNCTNTVDPLGIGQVSATRDGSDQTLMHVTVDNAYPGYQASCSLPWENTGQVPISSIDHRINGQVASGIPGVTFDLDASGEDDVLVRFSNGASPTAPGGTGTDTLVIVVLDTASPGATLQFTGTHAFQLAN